MRVLIQRVSSARVSVGHETAGAIDGGLLLLVGVTHDDTEKVAAAMAAKVVNLRLFEDASGQMNLSLLDLRAGGESNTSILVVSQFTLYANTKKGRRPSFTDAAAGPVAEPLIDGFSQRLSNYGVIVATGRFGAHMRVELVNDGPVTIWLDSAAP